MLSMLKKQKLFFFSLAGIVLVSIIMVTTYAYQTVSVNYNTSAKQSMTVSAGVLDVSFLTSNYVNISNMPLLNNYQKGYSTTFTIDNTRSTTNTAYKISLADLEYSNSLVSTDFKYNIVQIVDGKEILLSSGDFSNLNGNEYYLYFTSGLYRYINQSITETIKIYFWINETDENQNSLENASFRGKINITSVFGNEVADDNTLAGNILSNSVKEINGTNYTETPITIPGKKPSLYIEKGPFIKYVSSNLQGYYITYADSFTKSASNTYTLNNPKTCIYKDCYQDLVGKYIARIYHYDLLFTSSSPRNYSNSTAIFQITQTTSSTFKYLAWNNSDIDEKEVSSQADTNGLSYYFRGAVTDNYVSFANKCWRIVRINGNGSIKLILQNNSMTCSSGMKGYSFADSGSYGYETKNIDMGDGTVRTIDVPNIWQTGMKTTMSILENFQDTVFTPESGLLNYVTGNDFCYEDNLYVNNHLTTEASFTTNNLVYFTPKYRLEVLNKPTLICSETPITKFANGKDMFTSVLFADELIFAGTKPYYYTNGVYLFDNGYTFRTSSLNYFRYYSNSTVSLQNYTFHEDGCADDGPTQTLYYYIRPTINLKSRIEITGGDGTIDNAYTVQ